MATTTVNHGGVNYKVPIAPQNSARVRQIYNQLAKKERAEVWDGAALDAEDKRRIMAEARARELDEREKAAAAKFKAAHPLKQDVADPQSENKKANGPSDGPVGLSQRRLKPVESLDGYVPANKRYLDDANAHVMTNAQRDALVPALAEKFRKQLYEKNKPGGFIHKPILPINEGTFGDKLVDMAFQAAGLGKQHSQIANFFREHDRFEQALTPPSDDFVGYTFFTRPRLNLSDVNLMGDRVFAPMMTTRVTDAAYAIRCFLDTQFCDDNAEQAATSPLINIYNPFNTLWSNACRSISGFQDPQVAVETSNPGYFGEEQTVAIGGDENNKTLDISCTFRDTVGTPVAMSFEWYRKYLVNLGLGNFCQYAKDIDANRLGYTISIYRFIVDRSWKTVTKAAKLTGCFPAHSPIGVVFNKSAGERRVTALDEFSITFKCNHVDLVDNIIFHEFNMLVRKFTGLNKFKQIQAYGYEPSDNHAGIPYIRVGPHGNELVFAKFDNDKVVRNTGFLSGTGLI